MVLLWGINYLNVECFVLINTKKKVRFNITARITILGMFKMCHCFFKWNSVQQWVWIHTQKCLELPNFIFRSKQSTALKHFNTVMTSTHCRKCVKKMQSSTFGLTSCLELKLVKLIFFFWSWKRIYLLNDFTSPSKSRIYHAKA